jgi:arylsulfatase
MFAALLLVAAVAPPPNVVFLLADDLGYADLSCYGATDLATPHLDRLAMQGTRFTGFTVAQAVCTASRTALLTGCYPNRLGLEGALNHTSTVGLNPAETTLAELFRAKGYATACFGKWHLGHRPPFLPTRRGFDRFAGLPYSNDNGPDHPTVKGLPPLPWYDGERVTETDPDQANFTRRLTDLAVGFIKENRQKPFFLYLPHVMPHVPIFASDKFRGSGGRGRYGDVVRELDAGVGEVLAALDECGLTGNTLVLFASDNGPFLSYGEHAGRAAPFREGKLTAFEGGVRVPFVARWPGHVPAGRTSDELFTGLDLLPTLAAVAGLRLPKARIDGQDLSPLLLGKPGAAGRESFAYYSGRELHAVRKGRWKLHLPHDYLTVDGPPGTGGKPANFANIVRPTGIEQSGVRGIASRHGYRVERLPQSLFDLSADPGEATDVSAKHPQVVAELLALAAATRADLGDGAPGPGCRPPGQAK